MESSKGRISPFRRPAVRWLAAPLYPLVRGLVIAQANRTMRDVGSWRRTGVQVESRSRIARTISFGPAFDNEKRLVSSRIPLLTPARVEYQLETVFQFDSTKQQNMVF